MYQWRTLGTVGSIGTYITRVQSWDMVRGTYHAAIGTWFMYTYQCKDVYIMYTSCERGFFDPGQEPQPGQ